MERVVEILMEREGLQRHDAIDLINEARDAMEDCNYEPYQCEEILADYLGLEPDYMFDIIGY